MTKKTSQNNKNRMRVILAVAFAAVGVALLAFTRAETPGAPQSNNAGAASYSITPSSGSKALSANFTVAITEDSGAEPVNTVDVRLTYDAAKLNFVSVDNTGGVFDQCFEKSGGNGLVVLTCSKLGGSFTGSQKVGEVVFSPKVGSGSTSISFANTSHLYKADGIPTDIWDQQTAGATYALTGDATPDPTPTPTTTPTTSGGSSTSGGTSSGGTKKTTPTTTTPRSGAVAQNTNPTTTTPASEDTSRQTVGSGAVTIVVSDSKGKPVSGAKVTLNKQTVVTDASGSASFVGVAAGKYTLKASGVLGAATKEITIVDNVGSTSTEVQKFELVLKKEPNILVYVGVAVIVVLVGLLIYLGKRWRRNRPAKFSPSLSGMVVNGKDLGASADEPVIASPVAAPSTETKPEHQDSSISTEVQAGDTIEEIEKKVAAQKAKKPATHPETKAKTAVFSNFMPATGKDLGEQMIKPTKPPTDPL